MTPTERMPRFMYANSQVIHSAAIVGPFLGDVVLLPKPRPLTYRAAGQNGLSKYPTSAVDCLRGYFYVRRITGRHAAMLEAAHLRPNVKRLSGQVVLPCQAESRKRRMDRPSYNLAFRPLASVAAKE